MEAKELVRTLKIYGYYTQSTNAYTTVFNPEDVAVAEIDEMQREKITFLTRVPTVIALTLLDYANTNFSGR